MPKSEMSDVVWIIGIIAIILIIAGVVCMVRCEVGPQQHASTCGKDKVDPYGPLVGIRAVETVNKKSTGTTYDEVDENDQDVQAQFQEATMQPSHTAAAPLLHQMSPEEQEAFNKMDDFTDAAKESAGFRLDPITDSLTPNEKGRMIIREPVEHIVADQSGMFQQPDAY